MKTIDDEIREAMQPTEICPLCGGSDLKMKLSFKGRSLYRNKRKTQYCSCGWSMILPTEREAITQIGLID